MSLVEATTDKVRLIGLWDQYWTQNQGLLDKTYLEHDGECRLDYRDIEAREPQLSQDLLDNPREVLRACESVVKDTRTVDGKMPAFSFHVTNLPSTHLVNPKDVRSGHIGGLIGVPCIIKKATEVYPRMTYACYECRVCGNREYQEQMDWEFQEKPVSCSGCDKNGPWFLREEESTYVDEQRWLLSDDPSMVEPGLQPQEIQCIVQGGQVNQAKAGEQVIVNGFIVPVPKREGQRQKQAHKVFLVENSVEHLQKTHASIQWNRSEEEEFKEFAKEHNVLKEFRANFATNIHGLDDVKSACVLSIVGGVREVDAKGNTERGDIHVLLAGSPGCGKSQCLESVPHFTPRSIYASGEGATAAGLTATVVKSDFGDGAWTLEVGAMGLASGGTFVLDEMDKMNKRDMGAMHLAMEQQRVEVHKASVHGTIHTECNVIAACNPKFGEFDPHEDNDMGQIDMPKPMFSRFDLIFTLKGDEKKETVQEIAEHILGVKKAEFEDLDGDWVKKYIAYAKTINPSLSEQARDLILEYFVNFKTDYRTTGVNYRALHSLRRLTQAHARLNLREVATLRDAEVAIDLYRNWANAIGYDEHTGKWDTGVADTGVKYTQHERNKTVLNIIKDAAKAAIEGHVLEDDVYRECKLLNLTEDDVDKAISQLKRDSAIYAKGGGGTWAPI